MNQVFYRQPLTTDTIDFENTLIEQSNKKYIRHGIIPVYYPEFDSFSINFDDEFDEFENSQVQGTQHALKSTKESSIEVEETHRNDYECFPGNQVLKQKTYIKK